MTVVRSVLFNYIKPTVIVFQLLKPFTFYKKSFFFMMALYVEIEPCSARDTTTPSGYYLAAG